MSTYLTDEEVREAFERELGTTYLNDVVTANKAINFILTLRKNDREWLRDEVKKLEEEIPIEWEKAQSDSVAAAERVRRQRHNVALCKVLSLLES